VSSACHEHSDACVGGSWFKWLTLALLRHGLASGHACDIAGGLLADRCIMAAEPTVISLLTCVHPQGDAQIHAALGVAHLKAEGSSAMRRTRKSATKGCSQAVPSTSALASGRITMQVCSPVHQTPD
jgi:hypothetical protein